MICDKPAEAKARRKGIEHTDALLFLENGPLPAELLAKYVQAELAKNTAKNTAEQNARLYTRALRCIDDLRNDKLIEGDTVLRLTPIGNRAIENIVDD